METATETQQTGPDLVHTYRRSVRWWAQQSAGVADDQWDLPTPCSDWTVRDLVNHVVGEDLWTAPLMRGHTIADVGARLEGDLLGDDPRSTAASAAIEAIGVVEETLPLHGTVHLSYGEESMDEYVRQLVADHLIHGWDLAAATGRDRTLDPGLVAEVAAWFVGTEVAYRSGGAVGPRMPSGAGPVASNTQSSVISAMIASTSPRPNAPVNAANAACAGPQAASRPKRARRSLCGSPRDGIRGPTAPPER